MNVIKGGLYSIASKPIGGIAGIIVGVCLVNKYAKINNIAVLSLAGFLFGKIGSGIEYKLTEK